MEMKITPMRQIVMTRTASFTQRSFMWRNTLIMTLLVGLVLINVTTAVLAETSRALEAEARRHGAPMVWVSDGAFTMGSPDGRGKNQPSHEVYLNAFYVDQFEVTTARYATFLKATGQGEPGFVPKLWEQVNLASDGDRPVMGVNWDAAHAYCRWAGKRLLTEAEWEKAARGLDGRRYPWGNAEPAFALANYGQSISGHTYRDSLRPVGSYEGGKSPYGIYDMAGNVSEWVADWYDERYYATSPKSNPQGPARGMEKVIRGGSFVNSSLSMKAMSRESTLPTDKGLYVGIRCAQDAF
jgi:formylglycine-generating enzyme required for sulfatase activity